jgi:pyrimidine operon attenuation protein/uracil phosphoribosyltransferase
LPIQPDVVGKRIDVPQGSRIDVMIEELDGRDAVIQAPREGAA